MFLVTLRYFKIKVDQVPSNLDFVVLYNAAVCMNLNIYKFPGFPSLGVLLQKLENPALRACLKVKSNEVCLSWKCISFIG